VLLRSDGRAVACGQNTNGSCTIPSLEEGISYIQVSAGMTHTVLLRSDGQAVANGENHGGKCTIPSLEEGITYTQVSAGMSHTALLKSDGGAVACGENGYGQCDIPPLEEGFSYVQVCAGGKHTVLLRSDGQVVACGKNREGQCNIPSLKSWGEWFGNKSSTCRYVCDVLTPGGKDRVVQLDFLLEDDAVILTCVGLDGMELLRLKAQKYDVVVDVSRRIARELNISVQSLRLVLPDGQLVASVIQANPKANLSDVISTGSRNVQ